MKSHFFSPGRTLPALAMVLWLTIPAAVRAQDSSSSERSQGARPAVEAAGSGTTLEFSESLFDISSALNVCGYDTGLEQSLPVRAEVRADLNQALASSPLAQSTRDRMCNFILQHRLSDSSQNTAQYVYLSLYATPPPELSTSVTASEMVPAAADVLNLLPLLRAFADATQLHLIWLKHRPEYEALQNQIHDPVTRMILETNTYLKLPVSNYDGRRFVVLLEPMLAPSQTNSLLYDVNYFVVTSPAMGAKPTIKLDDIRHTYLHYQIEPMLYARTATLDNFLPLLRHEQSAPVDFVYKSDITALLTECLIKAIEVHLMDVGLVQPKRPDTRDMRATTDYNNAMNAYNRQAEATRRAAVDRDMRQGWAVTQYFYDEIGTMTRTNISLQEGMGPMLFGMEIGREQERESKIVFDKVSDQELVRRAPAHVKTEMETAESKLGSDPTAAEQIAKKVLADPAGDHGAAEYMLGRIALLHGDPEGAIDHFENAVKVSKDLRTVSWSHIYMGRLYDTLPDRQRAVAEYQAAMQTRDGKPDTYAAAQAGISKPFTGARRAPAPQDEELDPTGKAQKEAYRPDPTASKQ